MRWLREEACQPHRDIPLTNNLVVPLALVAGGSLLWAGLGAGCVTCILHLSDSTPILCRVVLVSKSVRSGSQPVFCLVSPSDVGGRIAVDVDDSLCPKGEGTPLPSLTTLDPPLTYQAMDTLGLVSDECCAVTGLNSLPSSLCTL